MATKGDVSDLDTLLFGGKPMVPTVNNFNRARRPGTVETDLPGGATRQRKKYFGTVYTANATFFLDDVFMQDYVKSFFTKNEGEKFICYLSADRPIVEPYVVQVLGPWTDDYVSQADGSMSVEMEIFSAKDYELDDFLNGVYPVVGSDITTWLAGFEEIVIRMPDA